MPSRPARPARAVGRVFTSGEPEMSHNLQRYDRSVYLRVAEAQRCRINSTLLMPVYASPDRAACAAVFEVALTEDDALFPALADWLRCCLEEQHLHTANLSTQALEPGLRLPAAEADASAFESGVAGHSRPPGARALHAAEDVEPSVPVPLLLAPSAREELEAEQTAPRPREQEGDSGVQAVLGAAGAAPDQALAAEQQQQQQQQQQNLLQQRRDDSQATCTDPASIAARLPPLQEQAAKAAKCNGGEAARPAAVPAVAVPSPLPSEPALVMVNGSGSGGSSGGAQPGPQQVAATGAHSGAADAAALQQQQQPGVLPPAATFQSTLQGASLGGASLLAGSGSDSRLLLQQQQQQQPGGTPAVALSGLLRAGGSDAFTSSPMVGLGGQLPAALVTDGSGALNPQLDTLALLAQQQAAVQQQQQQQAAAVAAAGMPASVVAHLAALGAQALAAQAANPLLQGALSGGLGSGSFPSSAAAPPPAAPAMVAPPAKGRLGRQPSRQQLLQQQQEADILQQIERAGTIVQAPSGIERYGAPNRQVTLQDLQNQFGYGLKEAAARLGICPTTLKRACRRFGIPRWPRRQLARLKKGRKGEGARSAGRRAAAAEEEEDEEEGEAVSSDEEEGAAQPARKRVRSASMQQHPDLAAPPLGQTQPAAGPAHGLLHVPEGMLGDPGLAATLVASLQQQARAQAQGGPPEPGGAAAAQLQLLAALQLQQQQLLQGAAGLQAAAAAPSAMSLLSGLGLTRERSACTLLLPAKLCCHPRSGRAVRALCGPCPAPSRPCAGLTGESLDLLMPPDLDASVGAAHRSLGAVVAAQPGLSDLRSDDSPSPGPGGTGCAHPAAAAVAGLGSVGASPLPSLPGLSNLAALSIPGLSFMGLSSLAAELGGAKPEVSTGAMPHPRPGAPPPPQKLGAGSDGVPPAPLSAAVVTAAAPAAGAGGNAGVAGPVTRAATQQPSAAMPSAAGDASG